MSWDQVEPSDGHESGAHDGGSSSRKDNGNNGKQGKSIIKGCLVGILALVGVGFLLMVSITLIVFATFMSSMTGMGGAGQSIRVVNGVTLTERTVSGKEGDKKVAIVPLYGLLIREKYRDPVRELNAMLEMAATDPQVEAVILEVETGGGSVHVSDLLYDSVKEFNKPVVVLMGGVAASGGYYVSCGADSIVARRTTITGSIGVLLPLYDVTGLMEKIGVEDRSVASGPHKALLSPTQEHTEEEMQRLQDLVNSMHQLFVEVVAEGRAMEEEDVSQVADGNIYTAQEALENGLVDKVGYLQTAVDEAVALAKLGKEARPHLVRYGHYKSFLEMILARADSPTVKVELTDDVTARLQNEPLYLWSPGTATDALRSQ